MFIRETSRKNKDGTTITYVQLVESIWDSRKKRAVNKVVYSLGRKENVDVSAIRRLIRSLSKYIGDPIIDPEGDDSIDLWSKRFGVVYIAWKLWQELGIHKELVSIARRYRIESDFPMAVFSMVANRMVEPLSKHSCDEWCKEDVYFPGFEKIALQHLYRAMDMTANHKYEIEARIYNSVSDLLNMDVDLIFYDTTTVYFELDEEDSVESTGQTLRKRGYNKDGKSDLPQVVIGLAVTRDGYPVRSWVFDGNTSDVSTIAQVRDELRGWRLNRSIWCADRGMVSKENLKHLSAGGSSYIVGRKLRAGDEVEKEVLSRRGRFKPVCDNLEVKEVLVGQGEGRRRYIVCFNPQRAERDRNYRNRAIEELEAELESGDVNITTVKGRTLSVSRRYRRYIRITKTGKLRIDRAKIESEKRLDGKFVLQTNDDSLTPEDVALGYKQLMRVEEAFRTLKGPLSIRPMYHRLQHRIESHVLICMIALLIERVAENRTGESWEAIRRESARQSAICRQYRDGTVIRLTRPTEKLLGFYSKLKVPEPGPILEISTP